MNERSRLLFIVLTICGTICILGALVAAAVLYQMNSVQLNAVDTGSAMAHKEFVFALFAWGPSLMTLVAGIGMVTIGVRAMMREE